MVHEEYYSIVNVSSLFSQNTALFKLSTRFLNDNSWARVLNKWVSAAYNQWLWATQRWAISCVICYVKMCNTYIVLMKV